MTSNNHSYDSIPSPPPLPAPPTIFQTVVSKRTTNISDEKKHLYKIAWGEVKSGSATIYSAAKKYGLSKSTLRNWCLKDELETLPVVGRPCYFGTSLEDKLQDWILESFRAGNIVIVFPTFFSNHYNEILSV